MGTVIVGFSEFNGFYPTGKGGSLKGVVEFKFAFGKHRIDATLLPCGTTCLGGFTAADGHIHGLTRRPRAVDIKPHRHGGVTEAEIPNVAVAGGHLPHVG